MEIMETNVKTYKVSVIIPTYNVEPYLRECMESVVRQTLEDIEIICINDGSTDNSLEILNEYAGKDERITVIDRENGGYGSGMNLGLDRATGEYVGIVEPDDYIALNMFEDLYEKAKQYDLDFVKADFYRFTRNKNEDMELMYIHLSKNPEDYNTVFDPSVTPQAISFAMNTWCGIYRRSFLEENHIRHNETPGASFQDNGFWFQTFAYGKRAMILDTPYYRNRRDNPNSSVSSPQKVYCMNVEYDHIRRLLVRDREVWERFRSVYWLKKYHNYINTLRRIAPKCRKEYSRRIAAEFKRGIETNEIDEKEFTVLEWDKIQSLIKNPDGFYEKKIAPHPSGTAVAKADRLNEELEHIKKSYSYRLGMFMTYIPRKIRRLIIRIRSKLR